MGTRRSRCLLGFALLATLRPAAVRADELLVFAAASLSDALQAIAPEYQKSSGDHLTFSFGASSDLARQIVAGAPADAFFSADTAKMDTVEAAGLVRKADRANVLSNVLAIVVPHDAEKSIRTPAELLTVERIALADPETVPAGVYARKYLTEQGLWDRVKEHVVPTADVRAALAAVEGAHAEAGIVYKTDAAISKNVRVTFTVPRDQGPPITYVLAPLAKGADKPAAQRLMAYLTGPAPRAVYERFGFVVLPAP